MQSALARKAAAASASTAGARKAVVTRAVEVQSPPTTLTHGPGKAGGRTKVGKSVVRRGARRTAAAARRCRCINAASLPLPPLA